MQSILAAYSGDRPHMLFRGKTRTSCSMVTICIYEYNQSHCFDLYQVPGKHNLENPSNTFWHTLMQQAARFTASSFTLWSSCTHNDCFAIAHARCWHDHNIVLKCPRCNADIYSFNDIITGGHDWEEKQIRKLLEKGYTMRQIMQHVNHSITHRECADAALAYFEKKKKATRIKLRNKTYRALKKKKKI